MKLVKYILFSVTIVVFAAGLILNFNSCSEQSPLESSDETISTKRAPGELKILKTKTASLNKVFVEEKLVKVEDGRKIKVGDDEHGESVIHFKPGDVSQDVLVRFYWESEGFLQGGVEFSPHGTTFNNPVKIKLSYKDADLGDINENDIRIWYFNETDGTWELIGGVVNTKKKHVKGYITHFSRYALSLD